MIVSLKERNRKAITRKIFEVRKKHKKMLVFRIGMPKTGILKIDRQTGQICGILNLQ